MVAASPFVAQFYWSIFCDSFGWDPLVAFVVAMSALAGTAVAGLVIAGVT